MKRHIKIDRIRLDLFLEKTLGGFAIQSDRTPLFTDRGESRNFAPGEKALVIKWYRDDNLPMQAILDRLTAMGRPRTINCMRTLLCQWQIKRRKRLVRGRETTFHIWGDRP